MSHDNDRMTLMNHDIFSEFESTLYVARFSNDCLPKCRISVMGNIF